MTLPIAGWALGATVVLGLLLACRWMMGGAGPKLPRGTDLVHGSLGIIGTVVLLVALRGPPRGVSAGAGGFGATAASLLVAAILAGVAIFATARRGRSAPSVLVVIHAMLGASGYLLLAAWWSL